MSLCRTSILGIHFENGKVKFFRYQFTLIFHNHSKKEGIEKYIYRINSFELNLKQFVEYIDRKILP